MGIVKNNKNIAVIFHGERELAYKYHGNKLIWQKNRLPVEYREVKYIESNGKQYIDTQYKANKDTHISAEFSIYGDVTPNNRTIFGARTSSSGNNSFCTYVHYLETACSNYNNEVYTPSVSVSKNVKHKFEQNKNVTLYDNTVIKTYTYPETDFETPNIFLLNMNENGSAGTWKAQQTKLYSVKIWDDGSLTRNFIPCVRVSDRTAGMYDTVTKEFYSSATSTKFKHGAYKDTFARICTELEYIESTGSQYFDTEINATNELKLYSKVSTSSSTELLVFGASANETRLGMVSAKGIEPIGNIVFQYGKQNLATNVVTPKNTIMELTLNGNLLYKDGELIYKGTKETFDVEKNLYMFATNSPTTRYGIIKIYKAYIEKNGVLLRNFVPCIYKPTGKIGMYDTVSGDIFVSETQSEFIASN